MGPLLTIFLATILPTVTERPSRPVLPIADGRLRGDQISFSIGDVRYEGRVSGDHLSGRMTGTRPVPWSAERQAR